MNKALILEDQKIHQSVLKDCFKNTGYALIIASDGEEGLEILSKNPDIKIIFTDRLMLGMDGDEFIEQVRAKPEFRDLPIIGFGSFKDGDKYLTEKVEREDLYYTEGSKVENFIKIL